MSGKAKGKGKSKEPKGPKPAWISDELWLLSNNLPALIDNFRGASDKSAADKTGAAPSISKAQAGLFLWQQLFANDKATQAKRAEALKLECLEVAVRNLASGVTVDMTPSAGIINALSQTDVARDSLLFCKPPALPLLLDAVGKGSPSLAAAALGVLRTLAQAADSRPRIVKAMRDWDWAPLAAAINMEHGMPLCGGRLAAADAVMVLHGVMCAPATPGPADAKAKKGGKKEAAATAATGAPGRAPDALHRNLLDAGCLSALIKVCMHQDSTPQVKAAAATVILEVISRGMPDSIDVFLSNRGVDAMVAVLADSRIGLAARANAAACLRLFIISGRLAGEAGDQAAARTAETSTSQPQPLGSKPPAPVPQLALPTPVGAGTPSLSTLSIRDRLGSTARPRTAGLGASPMASPSPAAAFSASWWDPEQAEDGDRIVLEAILQDDERKEQAMARVQLVAASGAIPWLVGMCVGPDGPLPVPSGDAASPAAPKAKAKKGKKKAGKLEEGMAEAQAFAAGCLRLMSLSDATKRDIMQLGGVRYLAPLLDSRNNHARWNARQTLLNLAMLPEHVPTMTQYKVPNYIHGANLPRNEWGRPFTAPASLGRQVSRLGLGAPIALGRGGRTAATAPANTGNLTSGLG
ncbi:hypothetical protein WJX72_007705 [[Myrmecia] bisecta]|uniref:Uncharacterized protein n=1 Tax=[Myrmecia] bisecta TaxID=41462 RepID=A0AAW1QRA1_9CHLO